MRRAALALTLAACTAPPALGTVRVAVGPSVDGVAGFTAGQRAALAAYLDRDLDALGFDFVVVSEGAAEVVVRPAALGGACGRYTAGLRFVEVDPACPTGGLLALQRAAGHEVVHALMDARWGALLHVCDWPLNAPRPAGCSVVRCPGDDCLMSRGLAATDPGPSTTEAYTGAFADPAPTAVDTDLLARCARAGRCE